MGKIKHFMYVPWTGLGLYGGFRGNRWLKNRIQIFKQFVIPSLEAQTEKNFTLWHSWRPEEKHNPIVKEFIEYLGHTLLSSVHTFHGLCFWDDKYPDAIASDRLLTSLHGSMGELFEEVGQADYVLMTIQPSDDCYRKDAVAGIQKIFRETDLQACGFTKGYVCNYQTKELAEWNPSTNPPFYTIKFPKKTFTDPRLHAEYTGPYKSHEYIGDKLRYGKIEERGFLVGTHGENISTIFNHPFKGQQIDAEVLKDFCLDTAEPLKIRFSIRKRILRMLPYKVQRKLRYLIGERFWARIYELLRS